MDDVPLHDFIDDNETDKNTIHTYLGLYNHLLQPKKHNARHVLEIGIGCWKEKNGGSIDMWAKFFTNATVHAIEILDKDRVKDSLINNPKVKLYTSTDAYDPGFVQDAFKNIKFDMLLDDGPHTLESMISFIQLYSDKIADQGILMIEDVQSIEWIPKLKSVVPKHLLEYVRVYDLRMIKNRYDDIVFTIDLQNFIS